MEYSGRETCSAFRNKVLSETKVIEQLIATRVPKENSRTCTGGWNLLEWSWFWFRAGQSSLESRPCHLFPVWLWAGCLAFLNPSFLIYEVGLLYNLTPSRGKDWIFKCTKECQSRTSLTVQVLWLTLLQLHYRKGNEMGIRKSMGPRMQYMTPVWLQLLEYKCP